ncbi:hypothetical protein B7435_29720 [Mycolicibacterium peregrinum]|uniref:DUF732 domain-containing protein n=1 Tax=Mycolicibacterium peregrinum TaxID=43304 RepID=A0A1X2ASR1_MYCPR|nr:hypothetical protein [Mycolicibacterium peregrinum]MCV7206444.1 hypothetical protein [Mycolicibacterium peregrinum]ORW54401.1 hypothetical protein AWC21_26185 [Mycolicibacterium peregrinum]OWL95665.1 hypothetical protein B7435_29720 [Mycolicibacterium peregrinum]TGB44723.1 hypothetical protein EJD94_09490 [Mycolicibacterium peregrinum]TGB46866.1 hypothetical protein EJD98_03010 [Mycolicibacterium peregrinum]
MMNIWKTVAIASVGAGLALGTLAAPAAAAPGGAGSAQQTIKQLEDEGYRVILSRVGSGSINDCNVKAVRPGRDITELKAAPRGNTEERVRYTTVYVDLACGQGK